MTGRHSELIGRLLGVNEWLVLAVAQDRGVRHRDGVFDRSRLHRRSYVHVFLQLFAGIVGLDAGLQSARVGSSDAATYEMRP